MSTAFVIYSSLVMIVAMMIIFVVTFIKDMKEINKR